MTTKYEEFTNISNEKYIIRTTEDGTISHIPCDESNADYQRYLRWLEDPNAPEFLPPTGVVTNGDN